MLCSADTGAHCCLCCFWLGLLFNFLGSAAKDHEELGGGTVKRQVSCVLERTRITDRVLGVGQIASFTSRLPLGKLL